MKRLLLIALLTSFAVACGGKQQKSETQPIESTNGDAADLDEVDAAELADSPCGNPDWSKLPDGSDAPDPSSN